MLKMKRFISIMLCILLVLMETPVAVFAVEINDEGSIVISTPEELVLINRDSDHPSDGNYYLEKDITISYEDLLKLDLDGFSGTIEGQETELEGEVYDADDNRIVIHNIYQLELLKAEDEPVLSGDYDAYLIGTGQVYESDGELILYNKDHNYVFASDFSAERKTTLTEEIMDEAGDNTTSDSDQDEETQDDEGSDVELDENNSSESSEDVQDGESDSEGEGMVNSDVEEDAQTETEGDAEENGAEGDAENSDVSDQNESGDADAMTSEDPEEESPELITEEISTSKTLKKSAKNNRAAGDDIPYPSDYAGRTYFGEVVREIDGEDYILIGDQQQLRAIGTDKDVTEPVWAVYYEKVKTGAITYDWEIVEDNADYPIKIFYPGDADLLKFDENLDWSAKALYDIDNGGHHIGETEYLDGGALTATKKYEYYGSKLDENNKLTYDVSANSQLKKCYIGNSAKYSYDANYIVFRDIFLTEDGTDDTDTVEWDPIDSFSGYMEGRDQMVAGDNPTIHHVEILQDTAIDQTASLTDSHMEYGVGFFRSLTTPYDNVLSIGTKTITVKNITLDDVSVDTTTTSINQDFSLIGALLTPILNLLNITSGLEEDPKSLATGGFVGVVKGRVWIEDCEITNLDHVYNANDWSGGFVGYSSGITQYEALSGILGGLTETLGTLLNLVPILGLGDLINILTNGGALDVKDLIPSSYTNSVMVDNLASFSGTESVSGADHVGGFVGEAEGAVFENCDVSKGSLLTVSGSDYVGGFAGNAENVIITGLLTELGVDVIGSFPVNSSLLNCDVTGSGALAVSAGSTVSGQGYAGGFVGRMANSYAVDCSVSGLTSVSGHDYVGGFTGYATTGELLEAGVNQGLVAVVKGLLTGILQGDYNAQLLNLVGLRPSVIAGADVYGGNISINASGKYAGGLVGYAGALQVSNTNALNDSSKLTSSEVARTISANGLSYSFGNHRNASSSSSLTVTSTDAAGGAIGYGEMTGVAGVLDGTATAVNYTRFELKEFDLNTGSAAITSDNAGGIIGKGIGGEIIDTHITGLASVNGTTTAGGFGGAFGSGTLANLGGINLLGLDVLRIDSIASLGQVLETYATDCSVEGIASGYTVETTAQGGASGGFIGLCISGKTTDCSADSILSVTAEANEGYAGGFVGRAKAGDAVSTIGESITGDKTLSALEVSNLLGMVSALRPEFDGSELTFVSNDNDQIYGDYAGGFIGDGEAIDVNYGVNHDTSGGEESQTDINNLGKVHGFSYAGGFAGRLQPGDVAQTGSVKLLGLLALNELLSVMDVAYPRIGKAAIVGAPLEVLAEGKAGNITIGDAGGYIGNGKAVVVEHSNLSELQSVRGAFHAGGYIGCMHSGTAADSGDATGALLNTVLGKLLSFSQLAALLQVASSDIQDCMVTGVAEGFTVEAYPREGNDLTNAEGYAGGYVGEMQSGSIDNFQNASSGAKGTAVSNLQEVRGYRYAGGFGGKVVAGAVAELAENASVVTNLVQASEALTLINAFRPEITDANVNSVAGGLMVIVTGTDENDGTLDSDTGSAGGYIGYGSGILLTRSDVNNIKHTTVSEPADLQSANGDSYYGGDSEYAVDGYKYAGGYFGKLDIGSTASIGGTGVFNKLISLSSIASALEVVLSEVEDCDTYGAPGGFNVIATNGGGLKGMAGGYAGNILGAQLKDCNSYNFAHIIGRVSAGGYVGTVEPGAVDRSVEDLSVLGGLINSSNLLGVLRSFIPEIINSETTCIPCGGVVRADAPSGNGIYRGLAGGYAGYNFGAQILGQVTDELAPKENAAIRIRSVYGYEYAGGFTGLMECANVADTGGLSALFGLIQLDNPLTLLQAVYPKEENTAVYGPLEKMSLGTWNKWVNVVAKYGPYGETLQGIGELSDEAQLNSLIDTYAYGYAVTGGRDAVAQTSHEGSAAGGYVGRMEGGIITNGHGYDLRSVDAFRAAGGFVGEMITADVAAVGGISLAGIDIVGNLPLLQTFVPVINTSSVDGYTSGAVVLASGEDEDDIVGVAGGYVGQMIGGQIWGRPDERIQVTNVKSIVGTSYLGGFVGRSIPGSAATVNTSSDTGLLHKVLDRVVGSTGDLADVLNATVSTIRYADVVAFDDYGTVINGVYKGAGGNTAYATAAGGFAGLLSGTVVGEEDVEGSGFNVINLRKVIAGKHAGGGFGIADVAAVAEVSAGDTNLASLIELGSVELLDAFKTYIYHSNVQGSTDAGLYVASKEEYQEGAGNTRRYQGNAGGFGGTIFESTVKDSTVTNLGLVESKDNAGGFAGYMGKSGAVAVNEVEIAGGSDTYNLLGGSLGVLDVFGSHAEECSVTGINAGYSVVAEGGTEPVSGGFVGYGDLSRVSNSSADKLVRVESDGVSGGFIGKTSFSYLVDLQLDSTLLEVLIMDVLNPIVRFLYLDEGTPADLPAIDLGFITIGLLHEDDLVSLKLFGLPISVSLAKDSETDPQGTDFAVVNIGDSVIKLPCTSNGLTNPSQNVENLRVGLVKANQTKVSTSTARGVSKGYDVFGTQIAGGFVGSNSDGYFEDTESYLCDTIESGEGGSVGTYSGSSSTEAMHYDFETLEYIEGNNNIYRVYRLSEAEDIRKANGNVITDREGSYANYSVYAVSHMQDIDTFDEYIDATIGGAPLDVYINENKAVLMSDVATKPVVPDSDTPPPTGIDDVCDEVRNLTINKIWKTNFGSEHPESIHVTVYRTVTIDGVESTEIVPGYEDLEITGESKDRKWQYIIRDLPVYTLDGNEEPAYYRYTVTEAPVEGYDTDIVASESTCTITNTEKSIIPTGVARTMRWGMLLMAVVFVAIMVFKRRRVQ